LPPNTARPVKLRSSVIPEDHRQWVCVHADDVVRRVAILGRPGGRPPEGVVGGWARDLCLAIPGHPRGRPPGGRCSSSPPC
jgi:hypothetical protein